MKRIITALLLALFLAPAGSYAIPRGDRATQPASGGGDKSASKSDKGDKDKKDFSEIIKDMRKVEGLFDLYIKDDDGTTYLAVKPDQLGAMFILCVTRNTGDGTYNFPGSMEGTYPFEFRVVNKKLQMIIKNFQVRADSDAPAARAVAQSISDGIFASPKLIEAKAGPKGEILVDASEIFVQDISNFNFFLGATGQTGFSFDKSNSYFGDIKSFLQNTEIGVKLHYATSKPSPSAYLTSPYSMMHDYHYSLIAAPKNSYRPRFGDDRMGNFQNVYEDYSQLDNKDPYKRLICRFHLEKEEPYAVLSKPKEPIVFWIDKNVPLQYRKAFGEGALFWNTSFEKIGFKDAIVVKQMPDDADWDPSDIRYNIIRWMVMPNVGTAFGQSRINPITGQTLKADISVCTEWLRWMYNYMEDQIKPARFDAYGNIEPDEIEAAYQSVPLRQRQFFCNYGSMAAKEAAFAYAAITTRLDAGELATKDAAIQEFVNAYLTEVVAHEVGHTIGFRHNFKATTFHTLAEMQDKDLTRKSGLTSTVMDYAPANIAPKGMKQGEWFHSTPGIWDDWMIEYTYKPIEVSTSEAELPELERIASRCTEPGLQYGTDEDALSAGSTRSIDPMCSYFDHAADQLEYYKNRIALSKDVWAGVEKSFEKEGANYYSLRSAFNTSWRAFNEASNNLSKNIGGYYHTRAHVGDPNNSRSYTPVPATRQREALAFIVNNIFSAEVVDIPSRLLNKLQSNREADLTFSVYSQPRLDYPLHDYVLAPQTAAMYKMFSATVLDRLADQQKQFSPTEEKFTMPELFTSVRRGIWGELSAGQSVNSFRRNLQVEHVKVLRAIYSSLGSMFPDDAVSLAFRDLTTLAAEVEKAQKVAALDDMTKAHLARVGSDIRASLDARSLRLN